MAVVLYRRNLVTLPVEDACAFASKQVLGRAYSETSSKMIFWRFVAFQTSLDATLCDQLGKSATNDVY